MSWMQKWFGEILLVFVTPSFYVSHTVFYAPSVDGEVQAQGIRRMLMAISWFPRLFSYLLHVRLLPLCAWEHLPLRSVCSLANYSSFWTEEDCN